MFPFNFSSLFVPSGSNERNDIETSDRNTSSKFETTEFFQNSTIPLVLFYSTLGPHKFHINFVIWMSYHKRTPSVAENNAIQLWPRKVNIEIE